MGGGRWEVGQVTRVGRWAGGRCHFLSRRPKNNVTRPQSAVLTCRGLEATHYQSTLFASDSALVTSFIYSPAFDIHDFLLLNSTNPFLVPSFRDVPHASVTCNRIPGPPITTTLGAPHPRPRPTPFTLATLKAARLIVVHCVVHHVSLPRARPSPSHITH